MVNFYYGLKADPHTFRQFTCRELLFLNYDCPVKDKRYDMWSEHSYFFYVLSGKKVWCTPGKTWDLTAGKAIFVKPGACIVEQYFEEPFCVLVFILPDSYILRFLAQHQNLLASQAKSAPEELGDLVIPVTVDRVMTAFYESLLPYFARDKNPPEELVELKFQELLLNLFTNPDNTQLISYLRYLVQPPATHLRQVMEQNFCYNLELADYARLCHRSLSSFKRDFMDSFGMTPGRWLLTTKLDYAQRLLCGGGLSIREVSFECGFENATHFSRAFKQKYGRSPQLYKRLTLKTGNLEEIAQNGPQSQII